MSKKTLLLNAVQELLAGNFNNGRAICENICRKVDSFMLGYYVVSEFSTSWEHYSGCKAYPVSGVEIWNKGIQDSSFWWTGEQAELRMSLLEHIKSELLKLTDEEVAYMFRDN